MAQKVQVLLLDDLDGSDADESVSLGLDGTDYEIDLSSEHATELRESMKMWVSHARRVGGRNKTTNINTRRPRAQSDTDLADVRTWARENGHMVSDRGRISQEIMEAYKNRHKITIPEADVTAVEGEPQEAPKPAPRRGGRKTASAPKAEFQGATA